TAQILIYVGAINILIVFAVMLINKPQSFNFFPSWTTGDGITCAACTAIAAAEAAIGLAIVLAIHRNRGSTRIDQLDLLKW
ncbi:unnamed protein product, partial [Sphagnum jensenii]